MILHNDPYGGATHSPDVAIVDPDLLRGRAGRLLGRLGARARHRRRVPGPCDRPRRQLVGGEHLPGGQAAGEGGLAGGPLEAHPRERPHAELQQRGHPGDDRRLRAREATLRRAPHPLRAGDRARRRPGLARLLRADAPLRRSRRCRTGATRPTSAGSTTTASTGASKLPVKIAVEIAGDEITFDLTGSSDEVPTGYNCPYEGTTVSAMTFITRMIFLDEATYPVFVPAERGHARPGQRRRAEGLDLQPQLPPRLLRPLLPGAAGGRSGAPCSRAGPAEPDHGRQLGASPLHRLLGIHRGGGRVLGLPGGGRGLLRREARAATASTRSTA